MHLAFILSILLIIILIGYAIFLYWAYRNQRFIFSPYVPNIGANLFQPGGKVINLTEAQITCRQHALGAIKNDNGEPIPAPASCADIDPYKALERSP
jgi:hypothetical protein